MKKLFESEALLVLDKPSGISLLADRSGAPAFWTSIKQAYPAAKLVHRLDKGTSGVLLVALSAHTQRRISQQLARRQIRKYYAAVVAGVPPAGRTLRVALPLKKGRKSRYRVAGNRADIRTGREGWQLETVDESGAASLTRLRLLAAGSERGLVALQAVTGRTHQLRVHLAWIGFPIIGDSLYGKPESAAQRGPRLALHCHRMVVPGLGTFTATLPALFQQLLDAEVL